MGDSFPKSTGQSQRPGHTSAEGGRRGESVVSQSCGPGVKYSGLPARLRRQGAFQSMNHFFDFGKESPMAPNVFQQLKMIRIAMISGPLRPLFETGSGADGYPSFIRRPHFQTPRSGSPRWFPSYAARNRASSHPSSGDIRRATHTGSGPERRSG